MIILDREKQVYTDRMTGLWNKMYLQKAFVKYVVQQKKLCSLVVVDLEQLYCILSSRASGIITGSP